ncbi:hypothetical protein [Paenibacillus pabuli]|uniref:hypothetical protein n=1 Tax=Paenibacillus pabuli TaxID=1472 RepID=UPI0020002C31|nr:hypothetical protein [Paenibacillus pabuli]UPK45950.1 hypothetical protein KET34_11075 [Paenibacillus pabuli]
MTSKVTKFLINTFLMLAVLCISCVFIAMFRVVFPSIDPNDWDILAFVGSMIAAIVTIVGIRVPILAQRREQRKAQYRSALKQLHVATKEMRRILDVHHYKFMDFETNEVDLSETLGLHADFINDYIESASNLKDTLIDVMEWEEFEVFENKLRRLQGFLYYKDSLDVYLAFVDPDGVFVHEVNDYLNQAVELEKYLIEYQENTLKKYKELSQESGFKLFG